LRLEYLKTIIAFWLAIYVIAWAQDVSKVTLRGDIPPRDIKLANRNGATFAPDSLAADSLKIVGYYQNQGWLDCRLSMLIVNTADRAFIEFRLQKGVRYRLDCIPSISGSEDSAAAGAKSIINSYSNQFASSIIIEKIAEDILRLYARVGYPYCTVCPGNYRKLIDGKLQVSISINPGPQVMVRRIEFKGIRNISQEYLNEYSGLRLPFRYSSDILNTAIWRLNHARFLKGAGFPELRYIDAPETGIVFFPIEEISPVIIDGALGYSSKDKSLYGMVNGIISNILGGGRQFIFNLSRKDKVSRKLRFNYIEPLIVHQTLTLDLAAYQDDRDSIYIETGGQAGVTYSSIPFEYGLSFGASRIVPESYGRSIIPNKNRLSITLNFVGDTRDYPANPKSGDYLQLEANFINETVRRDSVFTGRSSNFRTVKIDYQKSIAIGLTSSIYGRVYGRGDFSGLGAVDRQYAVGGFGSLRGYNQDIFYVMRAGVITVEYRLLTGKEGRAYIFGDMGFLQKGLGSNKIEKKVGFGIGIVAPTPTGLAIVELAAPSDEGVSAAKLHFGLRAGF
jgi:outer membrane protein assembly factor BamA